MAYEHCVCMAALSCLAPLPDYHERDEASPLLLCTIMRDKSVEGMASRCMSVCWRVKHAADETEVRLKCSLMDRSILEGSCENYEKMFCDIRSCYSHKNFGCFVLV